MRVLVTGAGGFVGAKLTEALARRNYLVGAASARPLPHPPNGANTMRLELDLLRPDTIRRAVRSFRPDAVVHLAAQSTVRASWEHPDITVRTNTLGTIELLKALKDDAPEAVVLTVGSSEEYGASGMLGGPLTEETPCMPQNPYAVSKYAAGQIALQFARMHRLHLIHARPFNHFGPGQKRGFVVADFISQIVAIERGLREPVMSVGDLSAERDFTYVDDVVDAYIQIIERKPGPGIYNVCSGVPRTVESMLALLLQQSAVSIGVMRDERKRRPAEVKLFIGSAAKLGAATGWTPKTKVEAGLIETLRWWRLHF